MNYCDATLNSRSIINYFCSLTQEGGAFFLRHSVYLHENFIIDLSLDPIPIGSGLRMQTPDADRISLGGGLRSTSAIVFNRPR